MNKLMLSVVAALAVSAVPAFAADMPVKAMKAPAAAPSPWDIAFGVAFTTNYELRGISQSRNGYSENGYFEVDYTINDMFKLYAGIHGYTLNTFFADAEFDLSGGGRFTFGNFGLDVGYVYYDYQNGVATSASGSFGEFYAIPTYKFNDWLTVGGVVDWGPNFNNKVLPPGGVWTGSANAGYYAGNAVITLPVPLPYGITVSLNPELGRQWFDSNVTVVQGAQSYTYWDVGLDFVYKAATLDLRYWDTNLSRTAGNCISGGSTICSSKFVATLKFDTSFSALK